MAENLMPEILNRRGFSIGEKNDLLFEESLQEIADRYGTPCYIYSEKYYPPAMPGLFCFIYQ